MFNNQPQITQQILELIKTILYQNYFQYNDKYYQPTKGTAMGSPTSSTIAEIYLQYFEETIVKHWMETKEIIYYKQYVDIIIINQALIKEETVPAHMNNIDKYLEFKMTEVVNHKQNKLSRRAHTQITTISNWEYTENPHTHYTFNHPL